MARIFSTILLAAGLVSATPRKISSSISTVRNTLSTATNTGSLEPCAIISRSLASQAEASSTLPWSVDPEDAYACLASVPVDQEGGIAQLDGLRELLEFQSSLGYLREPPPGYLYDGVDLIAGIQKLSKALSRGHYQNEYDFQNDVYRLFLSAHDGHLSYSADIRNVFVFRRSFRLISLSLDGENLPQPVDVYLDEQASRYGGAQDPDANYNRSFVNAPPLEEGSDYNIPIFDYKSTTFGLANGTNVTTIHKVGVSKDYDFDGVVDGGTFFDRFCASNLTNSTASHASKRTQRDLTAPIAGLNYATYDTIADLFQENESFAVLSVRTFGPGGHLEIEEGLQWIRDFEDVARNFTTTAKSAGKSKLVIDLRGNGGGMMILSYALFNILCPSLAPYGGFNIRASPLANHIGQSISGSVESRRQNWQSAFNYKHHLNTSLEHFTSWEEFYGPFESHNDSFMSVARENLNETFGAGELSRGGYNGNDDDDDDDDATSLGYAKEDMILLLDGQCASACSIFVETMKTEAGVRQVAIGGRAQHGPMQGVGGVKGSEVLEFPQLVEFIEEAKKASSTDAASKAYWNTDEAPNLDNISRAIARGHGSGSVNFKNTIRKGDDLITPLQFVYEAADCRIFYTPDMYMDGNNIYTTVYNAIWGDGECVSGSTGHPSSASGLVGSDALVSPPLGARPAGL